MEIGMIRISLSILVFIALGAVGFWLLHFVLIRRARRRLQTARGQEIVGANARLRVYLGLRSLAVTAMLAPLAVALVYLVAQWRIERSANDPTRLQAVIATRDFLERTLGEFTKVSAESWITALILLSLIWIFARYSGSRRRWKGALSARRKAYETLLAPETTEALLTKAQEADGAKYQKLQEEVARVTAANRAKIASVENAQVLSLPGTDGKRIPTSVAELRVAIAQFENEASSLESTEQPATP
jgi:hypothetical protein